MVYTWGGGGSAYNKGQCGHGHLKDVEHPSLVKALLNHRVSQISAGGYHTLALTHDGQLFAWGSNQYGECAQKSLQQQLTPVPVSFTWHQPRVNKFSQNDKAGPKESIK